MSLFATEPVGEFEARRAAALELAATLSADEALAIAKAAKPLNRMTRDERVAFVAANMVLRGEAGK